MTVYETFSLKTKTSDGLGLLVGGFCPQGSESAVIEYFAEAALWSPGYTEDPEILDRRLADQMVSLAPSCIPVLGACIHMPGIRSCGGGIIGDPKKRAESEMSSIESLGPELFLVSFPGGPGIAFKGSFATANTIWNMIADSGCCSEFAAMADKLASLTDLCLAVTDGSGDNAQGMVMTRDHKGVKVRSLSRPYPIPDISRSFIA